MSPLARSALVAAIGIVAVGGALYLIRPQLGPGGQASPSPSASPSIEGTWEVDFNHAEMVAAGLVDASEDNADNYGHFDMTFADGLFQISQLDGPRSNGSGTYSMSGATVTIHCSGWCDTDATFVLPVTVAPTTLTFGATGPTTFHVKPWSRVTPDLIEATWDVTFTRAEMLAAGIADQAEDNVENYGHFTISMHAGTIVTEHLSPVVGRSTGSYVISGNTFTATTDSETFSWPFTFTPTTLTFGPGGPVTLRVKPWTRIGP